jgi:succinate dehydrogenase/fumarate reductase flavoprotein subunit
MAGLCAAARLRELGIDPLLLEKGDRAGGSMRLSSCVVWRHRRLEDFRAECPDGDPALQRLVLERLDEGLVWLESLGAPVVARETGNPRTTGIRFDPEGLTAALVRAAGEPRPGAVAAGQGPPLILATGGFGARLAREGGLALRGNRWSKGDGLRLAERHGAATAGALDEFYGRMLPDAPVEERDYVRAAQLYGRFAVPLAVDGTPIEVALSWSEVELPQAFARAGGRGWLVVDGRALAERVRERTVSEMVEVASELGAAVRRGSDVGLPLPASPLLREPPFTAVAVRAGVTHTLGGLRVDGRARVLRAHGSAVPRLYAAGADVGAVASGGYASGLAAALVLGRTAAETCAEET